MKSAMEPGTVVLVTGASGAGAGGCVVVGGGGGSSSGFFEHAAVTASPATRARVRALCAIRITPFQDHYVRETIISKQRSRQYWRPGGVGPRSAEHTSELQSLMRISYAVFCLKHK